jgi:hypothetical protein
MRVLACVIAALLAASGVANAAADELAYLYAEVLRNPADSAASLR